MTQVEDPAPAGTLAARPLYRRPSTWLLVAWCVLVPLTILAGTFGLRACPAGQHTCNRAPTLTDPWRWWLVAAVGALVLLALCVVEARRPATADPTPSPRRYRRRWLVVSPVLGVLAGAHLVMLGPMVDKPFCATPVYVTSFMAYPYNCDSVEFTRLAHNPRRILEYHNERQSRPGYVAIAAAGTRTVGPIAHRLHLDRLYGQNDTAYIPLVLINLAATAIAVLLLAWLLSRLGAPTAVVVALGALVAVNEVTKPFTWTAHQQTIALVVPVATIAAVRWLLLARPTWRGVGLLGLGFGGASLVYGSFLITAGVVLVVLLARPEGGRFRAGWWRGAVVPAGVFGLGFAAPQLTWMAICRVVTGAYYNHEAEVYDEFVWPYVALRRDGLGGLVSATRDMTVTTIRELEVATVAMLVVGALAALAVLLRVRLAADTPEHRAIVVGAGLTVLFSVLFAWGIGIIASRLMFHAVPALFVVAGWLAARVTDGSRPAARLVGPAFLALAAVVMVSDIAAEGPYS